VPAGARVRIAHEQIALLRGLNRRIDRLKAELAELVAAHCPKLLAERGCGALTAAILIGHTAGNERFRSEAAFALKTGGTQVVNLAATRAAVEGGHELGVGRHACVSTRSSCAASQSWSSTNPGLGWERRRSDRRAVCEGPVSGRWMYGRRAARVLSGPAPGSRTL
jgi:hypothetical protein